jgi:DNA topoisomerase-2
MSIEKKFRKLSDIEHVLLRPGMYVGSIKPKTEEVFLPDEAGGFAPRSVTYNPAFLKIFDEIVSNSVDEHRRNSNLNVVQVTVDPSSNMVRVWDNGGIPVVKHEEHGEWIPEMVFSNLKAGSNFDDTEERLVAGTNGVGSTLTNIYSLKFQVRTCDGKSLFAQDFSENMTLRSEAEVTKTKKPGFTEITFYPDLKRFGMDSGIDDDHLSLMKRRCIDLAACNPKLKVSFNGEEFKFESFKDYCARYVGPENLIYDENARWKIAFAPSHGSFQQVSFVNSVETKDGGTHVEEIAWKAIAAIRERVKKKFKIDLKPGEIRNHLFVFVQADIVNPAFSSQTKEKLITEGSAFGSRYDLSEAIAKKIVSSEILQKVLDWARQKAEAEERRQLRELNKNASKAKVLKLIDAKVKEGRSRCTLALFEGDSASAAFRKYRDPNFQGAFPLRGKFVNVAELTASKIVQNQEVKDLLSAIGLKLGEDPTDLRYGKILIYADADPDGDSIAGLLINFFGRFWPKLFDEKRVYRVMTPLVVAKKGQEKKWFYTADDFDAWSKTESLSKWDIGYKKGLAALEDEEYREIIHNPVMFAITGDKNIRPILDHWFKSDPSYRKRKILGLPDPDLASDEPEEEGAQDEQPAE